MINLIAYEDFRQLTPTVTKNNTALYYEPIMDACSRFAINTHYRFAAFLAQVIHESGSFVYTKEIASGNTYTKRKDLGNLEPEAIIAAERHNMETGAFYKGHGLIQITGFYNHKKCGEALGLDLVNTPELLCTKENSCLSAAWFWQTHGCNELADEKMFLQITKVINGGTNGLADRANHYRHICNYLKI